MSEFTDRMLRAAKLDAELYEEVERDTSAMGQAIGVVLLASVAAGIANLGNTGIVGLLGGAFWALIGWLVWSIVIYFVGTRWFREPQTEADYGQLLRTIGFASSPGLIRIIGIIRPLYGIVHFVAAVWMIAAMVIAVRQALDYTSTGRAVIVCVVGFVIQLIIALVLAALNCGYMF